MIEPMRVRRFNGLWVVELLSAATNRWIIQGEHLTKEAAEADRKSWLVTRGEWKDWPEMEGPMPLELIDWSERYPNESSREIAIRQSTLCLCGRGKEIGRKRCWRCDNAAKVSHGALPEVSRASHYS
jgi:hypothetical protein